MPKKGQQLPNGAVAFTIGHSTRTIGEFFAMLKAHGITRLVDVRTLPRSRTNPQFNRDVLPESLAARSIAYVHVPELGGLRKPKRDSLNDAWRNASFRGFADHMQTPEFVHGIQSLLDWMRLDHVALMCAEAVPWRCHRSLIADALNVRGIKVLEIVSPTKLQEHKLTPFARVNGTALTYPAETPVKEVD